MYAKEYEVETKEIKEQFSKMKPLRIKVLKELKDTDWGAQIPVEQLAFSLGNTSSFNTASQEDRDIGENKEDLANVKGTLRSAKEINFLQGHLLSMKGIGSEIGNFWRDSTQLE